MKQNDDRTPVLLFSTTAQAPSETKKVKMPSDALSSQLQKISTFI